LDLLEEQIACLSAFLRFRLDVAEQAEKPDTQEVRASMFAFCDANIFEYCCLSSMRAIFATDLTSECHDNKLDCSLDSAASNLMFSLSASCL